MHEHDNTHPNRRPRLRRLAALTTLIGIFAGLLLWFKDWVSDPLVAAILASLVILGILTIFVPHSDHTG